MATAKKSNVPANVKAPQDHKPASVKEDVDGPQDVAIEWNGHEYLIPGEAFDDVEFLDAMVSAEQEEDDLAAFRAARALLGNDIWNEYRKNERGENGRVKTTGFMEFFGAVMEAAGRKNS